jgi:hypothetical protein
MEEPILFNGVLNKADANLPEGDYSDARNVVLSEDDQGNGGAFKKMRSITPWADLSEFGSGVGIVASTIDDDGNQYFLVHSNAIKEVSVDITSFPASAAGSLITQSSGARGYIYNPQLTSPATSTVYILQTSTIDFADGTFTIGVTGYTGVSTAVGSAQDVVFLVKVTTGAVATVVFAYELTETPTVVPDLVLVGNNAVWNYLYAGVPMSYYLPRRFYYATEDGTSGYSYDNMLLIKEPPTIESLATSSTDDSTQYLFIENTYVFAARYVYDSGEYSVLSTPITLIADKDASYDTITVDVETPIPPNVISVDYFVSQNGGSFRRAATNDAASTELNFRGELNESLSTQDSIKLFDSVPLSAEALESIKNRLFIANVVDDLPSEAVSVSVTIDEAEYADSFTNGDGSGDEDNPYNYLSSNGTVESASFEVRHLTNDSLYRAGVMFMDKFFRTRGVVESSIIEFNTGNFAGTTRSEGITVDVSTAPSWAAYAQLCLTRNLSKDYSIESYASGIYFEYEDSEGSSFISPVPIESGDVQSWANDSILHNMFSSDGYILKSIVIDPSISYSFQDGDFINIEGYSGAILNLKIRSVINGLIYCDIRISEATAFIGSGELRIEIFSPAQASENESSLFYETGLLVRIDSGESIIAFPQDDADSDQRFYDQYYTSIDIKEPIIDSYLDDETKVDFTGTGTPNSTTKGVSLLNPVEGSSMLYAPEDNIVSAPVDVLNPFNRINWGGAYSNSYWDVPDRIYYFTQTSAFYREGQIVPIANTTPAAAEKQIILKVLNGSEFYSALVERHISVASATGFSVGDVVTIKSTRGEFTGKLLFVSGTDFYIAQVPYKHISGSIGSPSIWTEISNGINTTVINSVANIDPGFDNSNYGTSVSASYGYSGKTLLPTDKCYIGRADFSALLGWGTNIFPQAENRSVADKKYQDISSIVFPLKDVDSDIVTGKLFIDITVTLNSGQAGTVSLSIAGGVFFDHSLGVLSGTRRITGVFDVKLNAAKPEQAALLLKNTSATTAAEIVIHKGSYMYGLIGGQESSVPVYSRTQRKHALVRQPNLRENDDFTWDRPYGRPIIIDSGRDPKMLETKIRWGERFIEDALLNPISSFNSSNQEFVPQESGAITKLIRTSRQDETGSVLLSISERETNSLYIGERVLTNNDGSENVVVSDSVIGAVQPLKGNWGTKHKKSVSRDNSGAVVFWDDYNRDVVRYTRGGLVPISEYKMKPYFRSKSGEWVSFYDKFHDLYFFSNATAGESVSFSQGELLAQGQNSGWKSFHDFVATLGGEQFNDYSFPIKDSIVYRTLGATFGVYFGSTEQAYLVLSKFSPINIDLYSMRLRGDLVNLSTYEVREVDVIITNDMGQQTSINEGFFAIEGSYIYSDIYRDENSEGGLSEGLPMIASNANIKVSLGTDSTVSQAVKEVYLNFNQSSE